MQRSRDARACDLSEAEVVEDIFLPIGGFYFGRGQLRLRTVLGSCVAITLWHPVRRCGGMCHYLLPDETATPIVTSAPPGMNAGSAMRLFLRSLRDLHTDPSEYVVKMFGGGNMFNANLTGELCKQHCSNQFGSACRHLPCKNVLIGRELLRHHDLNLVALDVGGSGSRQLVFELWSGDVWVRRGPELAVA